MSDHIYLLFLCHILNIHLSIEVLFTIIRCFFTIWLNWCVRFDCFWSIYTYKSNFNFFPFAICCNKCITIYDSIYMYFSLSLMLVLFDDCEPLFLKGPVWLINWKANTPTTKTAKTMILNDFSNSKMSPTLLISIINIIYKLKLVVNDFLF